MIKRYYQYEEINEIERKKVDLIPETAYREAIANALVHRDWSIQAHICILMFKDERNYSGRVFEWRDFLFEKSNFGKFVFQTAVYRDVWDRYPAYSVFIQKCIDKTEV